ncbi:MAG: cytochrome P450 [Acidimicrobiales bacterium]|nr:MAG: cytochrome P450 [Acidimicrobiales bacterium]
MAGLEIPPDLGDPNVRVRATDKYSLPLVRAIVGKPRLTEAVFGRTRWGNMFADGMAENPYNAYKPIMADGPVAWSPWYQQYFVTGYEEARAVLSSDAMEVSTQREVVLAVAPHAKMSDTSKALFRNFLLFVDPPDHTRLRSLVSRAFTPKQMRDLEPEVQRLANGFLDAVAHEETPDLFAAFNAPLPIHTISVLLGIPEEDWPFTVDVSNALLDYLNPFPEFDLEHTDGLLQAGAAFLDDLAEERRREPRDDLLSALVHAETDEGRLDRFEVVAMAMFLMFAGHETTSGSLGLAMVHLARNPDQRRLVMDDPELWPNAIEELLRYDPPLHVDPRAAKRDVTIGDVEIKAGKRLTVLLAAANRDPRRFDDPDELRLDRDEPHGVSFGHGIHHCIGAALARMQMRVGLRVFLERFGEYSIDDAAIEWKAHPVLRGPVGLPVRRAAPDSPTVAT